MNDLFKNLADEGAIITAMRQAYAASGIHLSAARIELLIKLYKIKTFFNTH